MKKIIILGAGTGGTILANKFRRALKRDEWDITIIDKDDRHVYQPGLLFVPFGVYKESDVVRSRKGFIPSGVNFVIDEITKVDPKANTVYTTKGKFSYDWLIIATGCRIVPEDDFIMVPGMQDEWFKNMFDFYTVEGAVRLAEKMDKFQGGSLVLNIMGMPFKCPVAPIEFVFLADWFLTEKGIRDKTEIVFTTPIGGMFTKPVAMSILQSVAGEKNIKIEPNFQLSGIDAQKKTIESGDGRVVNYDLLVSIPTNTGAQFLVDSGLSSEDIGGWLPTEKETLKAANYSNIYVIGDTTNVPTSKAGSVAHFEGDILFENLMSEIEGKHPHAKFDGHSNCFIESGFNKAFLIDFNYTVEPLPGKFPLPIIGPFDLLKETEINHWGKLFFKWFYWNMLIKGEEIPLGAAMSMAGKKLVSSSAKH